MCPKRAGHLNEETHFVLNRFGVEAPEYIKRCTSTGNEHRDKTHRGNK